MPLRKERSHLPGDHVEIFTGVCMVMIGKQAYTYVCMYNTAIFPRTRYKVSLRSTMQIKYLRFLRMVSDMLVCLQA